MTAERPGGAPKHLVFIGGAPRSGLTLLRALLDAHPAIACGPDLGAVPAIVRQWRDIAGTLGENLAQHHALPEPALKQSYARLIGDLLEPLRAASGKRWVAEKTNANVLVFDELHALFPDAPLVHVVRDGRDVAASLLRTGWPDASGAPAAYNKDPVYGATLWAKMASAGRAAGQRCGAAYIELRYEELVAQPKAALAPLLERIGERWNPAVTGFHRRAIPLLGTETTSAARLRQPLGATSIGRWRRDLSAAQQQAIMAAVGGVLNAFGYVR